MAITFVTFGTFHSWMNRSLSVHTAHFIIISKIILLFSIDHTRSFVCWLVGLIAFACVPWTVNIIFIEHALTDDNLIDAHESKVTADWLVSLCTENTTKLGRRMKSAASFICLTAGAHRLTFFFCLLLLLLLTLSFN